MEMIACPSPALDVAAESVRAGADLTRWFAYEAGRMYRALCEGSAERQTRKLVEAAEKLSDRQRRSATAAARRRFRQPVGGRVRPRLRNNGTNNLVMVMWFRMVIEFADIAGRSGVSTSDPACCGVET